MRTILKACAVIALALLAACAQPARMERMRVTAIEGVSFPDGHFLKGAIAVGEVKGGEPTNPMWVSEVGNAEFKAALESSLDAFGLLAPAGKGAYDAGATLISVQKPLVGFDLTVTSAARYDLTRRSSGQKVYEKTLETPFTANFSSSFLAVERLRLANEGAIRTNLEKFIRELFDLKPN